MLLGPVARAAVLALCLGPARVGAQAPEAPPPLAIPVGEQPVDPSRAVRLFLAAEARAGNAPVRPYRTTGARLTAGMRLDGTRPFGASPRRIWVYGELDLDAADGAPNAQPRLSSLALGGPGVGVTLSERLSINGAILAGTEIVELHDFIQGGWVSDSSGAIGVRLGAALHPARWGERFQLAPAVGVSLTLLWLSRVNDPLRHVSWGGFAPMLSVGVGAELASPPLRAGIFFPAGSADTSETAPAAR